VLSSEALEDAAREPLLPLGFSERQQSGVIADAATRCPNCSEMTYVGHGGCGSCRNCGHSQCD
jgi:hypothetical protein